PGCEAGRGGHVPGRVQRQLRDHVPVRAPRSPAGVLMIAAVGRRPARWVNQGATRTRRRAEGLGRFGLFAAEVLLRSVTDVVLRLRFRKTVLRHISDVVAGAGAVVVGGGMVFV